MTFSENGGILEKLSVSFSCVLLTLHLWFFHTERCMLKSAVLLSAAVSFFLFTSCSEKNQITSVSPDEDTPRKVAVEELLLSQDVAYLTIGETCSLDVSIVPDTADSQTVAWGALNPAVATVDQNGVVTAQGLGKTVIVASCDGVRGMMNIVVKSLPRNTFRIHYRTQANTPESYEEVGIYLEGTALPNAEYFGGAYAIGDSNYTYRSLLQFQQTDSFGMYAEVTVKDDQSLYGNVFSNLYGYNSSKDKLWTIDLLSYNEIWLIEGAEALYTSKPSGTIEHLEIDGDPKTICVGDTLTLTVSVTPATQDPEVTWQSSNQFYLGVTPSGLITGRSPGTASILVSAGGLVAEQEICVTPSLPQKSVRVHYKRFREDYDSWRVVSQGTYYEFEDHDAFGAYVDIPRPETGTLAFEVSTEFETEASYSGTTASSDDHFWVRQGTSEVFTAQPPSDVGAFKIVNSWSDKLDWEYERDGFFHVSYDALKKMTSDCFYISYAPTHEPRLIAVFELEGIFRRDFTIRFGVGDTASPRAIKEFMHYPYLSAGNYETEFPSNSIAFDLTDFLPIQHESVFMEIVDGGFNRTLLVKKFDLEVYDSYDSAAVDTFSLQGLPAYTIDGETSRFVLDSITVSARQPLAKLRIAPNLELTGRPLSASDMANYPQGSITIPKETLAGLVEAGQINVLDHVQWNPGMLGKTRATATKIDNSSSKHFPPIGSQENKGSCNAWAMGYYLATFNIARVKNWDLSNARWVNGTISQGYRRKIMSPDFLYNLINQGGDYGSIPSHAALVMADVGIASMETAPIVYNDVESWPSEESFREAPRYRHSEADVFWTVLHSDENIEKVKTLLRAGEIVPVAIKSRNMTLTDNDTYIEDAVVGKIHLDHMVTIVGYDNEWTVDSVE